MKKTNEYMRSYDYGKSNGITDVFNEITDLDETVTKKEILKLLKKKYPEYICAFGKQKPTKYENKFCYLKTYSYRGYKVRVYNDDYGQQYYFYFNNRCHGCGTYNFNYEDCIRYEIDHYLDDYYSLEKEDKRFFGAYLRYIDHEHTKMGLSFRGELLKTFDLSKYSEEETKQLSLAILNKLFESKEFQELEKERISKGNLYFSEMMGKDKWI